MEEILLKSHDPPVAHIENDIHAISAWFRNYTSNLDGTQDCESRVRNWERVKDLISKSCGYCMYTISYLIFSVHDKNIFMNKSTSVLNSTLNYVEFEKLKYVLCKLRGNYIWNTFKNTHFHHNTNI